MPVLDPLSALVLKGSAELGTTLINAFLKRSLENNPEKIVRIKSNITPHIDATYLRCSTIKTMLNPHKPAEFLSIHATQRFFVSGNQCDHYGMVEYIKSGKNNIIITGTGGSGKSMFTKYLWLSLFVHNDGKIPLFIELRSLNSISIEDLGAYIRYSISQGQASIDEKYYREHLNNGDFVIILDGFDEVLQEKRESIQKQIILMSENYPKLKIIVTSRPDGRFSSWPSFEVSDVAPLHKSDIVELIEKAEFAEDPKNSFLKRLKSTDLFEKHNSFLTNPLLASMMLLTFSHKLDIPDRMHLFYEQAFDALYQRHDHYKPGGYKRPFKTKLPEDVFKRIISYFCLVTYYDEKLIFTRDEAMSALKHAAQLAGAVADPSDFLDDLISCVCFLIEDGIQYTFSHRSFQEYFAAYCMTYVKPENFDQLISKFSLRSNDQVIVLLRDMNPEALRRRYVLPMADRFSKEIQFGSKIKSILKFFRDIDVRFEIRFIDSPETVKETGIKEEERSVFIALDGGNDFFLFVKTVERLRKTEEVSEITVRERRMKDVRATKFIFQALGLGAGDLVTIVPHGDSIAYTIKKRSRGNKRKNSMQNIDNTASSAGELLVRPDFDDVFQKSYMYEYLAARLKHVADYVTAQKRLETSTSNAMVDLFGRG